LHVGKDRIIVNRFDQPCPEERSRNAEHHVPAGDRGGEIRLLEPAARRIVSSSDREERVYSAIGCPVRIMLESGFAHRTVYLNKRRDHVMRTFFFRYLDLGIDGRTRSPYIRMRVTAGATVQIKAWTKALFRIRNGPMN
jgi:hypothetical protein